MLCAGRRGTTDTADPAVVPLPGKPDHDRDGERSQEGYQSGGHAELSAGPSRNIPGAACCRPDRYESAATVTRTPWAPLMSKLRSWPMDTVVEALYQSPGE